MNELIDFLKSLILTTVQIDKKYRETVPELLAQMKAIEDSSDEARKKRRKPKKMKLGKDGLYPREDDSIREWWTANKPEPSEDGSVLVPMQTIKSRVSLLRSRETQLQMILIMEILALEMVKGPEVASDSSLPVLPGTSEVGGAAMAPPPPPTKKRSKHNLPVLIDVHADRLTIWQSTASDELFLLEDSQPPSQGMGSSTDSKGSTPLKDFCVDVILPL
jgi:DNA replication regulator SLD3